MQITRDGSINPKNRKIYVDFNELRNLLFDSNWHPVKALHLWKEHEQTC